MRDFPNLTDREIKFYFANLVLAIEFLHTHNIVHCDVKPENLVIGADGYLMLTDFGLAQTLHSDDSWNRMGTLEYMSPEVLSDDPLDTIERRVSGDWWAAAVSLFEMKTLSMARTVAIFLSIRSQLTDSIHLWRRISRLMREPFLPSGTSVAPRRCGRS